MQQKPLRDRNRCTVDAAPVNAAAAAIGAGMGPFSEGWAQARVEYYGVGAGECEGRGEEAEGCRRWK